MRFRPCIDIHNGKVKQIVGASLRDEGDSALANFVSERDAAWYAGLYRQDGLAGGHIIMLNPESSEYYAATKEQALLALRAFSGGMQIGGGIRTENAEQFLRAGASHVIVTSYVFCGGRIRYDRLERISRETGKEHLVLDLSCRRRDGEYFVVTDRWQKFTEEKVTLRLLSELSGYCDEFLLHAVDVEGKAAGIDEELAGLLGSFAGIPATYAGGASSLSDLEKLKVAGRDRLDVTIGSALDIFGGTLPYRDVLNFCKNTLS